MKNGKRQREQQRQNARDLYDKHSVCANCGEKGKHFVPPSLGEPGFFTCAEREAR